MSTEANKALIIQHYENSINKNDIDAAINNFAADFRDHEQRGCSRNFKSRDGVRPYLEAIHRAVPDMHVTIEDVVAEGDKVAVRCTWRGTHLGFFRGIAPTGRRFAFTGMVFWRVVDGKITERWANLDNLGLMAQLGLVESMQAA